MAEAWIPAPPPSWQMSARRTQANVWKSLSPQQRLSHLSTLSSLTETKPHLLDEVIETAKASIPFLDPTATPKTSGVSVENTYHPVSTVAIVTQSFNLETSLAYSVLPLLAGCAVVFGSTKESLKNLSPVLGDVINCSGEGYQVVEGADVVVHAGSRRSAKEARERCAKRGVNIIEYTINNVALVLHDTAKVSEAVQAVSGIRAWEEVIVAVYACPAVCGRFREDLRKFEKGPWKQEHGDAASDSLREATSVVEVETLDEAVESVNGSDYDIVSVFGEATAIEGATKRMEAAFTAMNTAPWGVPLLAQGPETIRQFLTMRSNVVRRQTPFSVMKQYLVGRFDNSAQVAAEKESGDQRTGFSIHINDLLDDKIEGGPQEGVFHILEETYKYAPGQRNPTVAPLLLRFEDLDGRVALTSLQVPEGLDVTALRNDNPLLWLKKEELTVSKNLPARQVYTFDEEHMEFTLDVDNQVTPEVRLQLCETLGWDRFTVLEQVWISGALKDGYYEEPYLYDRIYTK